MLAAGGMPVAAPADATLPGEVGLRPGSWMIAPYGCTMNLIFTKSGSCAIGTASHGVDGVGQHVTLLTLAPGGADPVLVDVGTVVARHNNGIGDDFALVAINPDLYPWVNPTEAVVGGPCGQYAGSGPETVGTTATVWRSARAARRVSASRSRGGPLHTAGAERPSLATREAPCA